VTTAQNGVRQDEMWRPVVVLPAPAAEAVSPVPAPAAVLALAGGLRPSPLSAACGRSVLDLPLTSSHTVLSYWMERFSELWKHTGQRPEVRIIHNQHTPAPVVPTRPAMIEAITECEAREYRGPAGVAKDACERYAADATIVLVEGARCVTCSLVGLLRDHAATNAAVTVGCNPDGTPAGVYAIRRSALDLVPKGGFMDLKEQWLNRLLGSGAEVRVHVLQGGMGMPLRTLGQYLAAVGEVNGWTESSVHFDHEAELCDRQRTRHAVVGEGATVDPEAVLIDSVVMPGATVGRGAIIARSLVCEGAVISAGAELVEGVAAGRLANGIVVRKEAISRVKA
jgi:hypothetical protein